MFFQVMLISFLMNNQRKNHYIYANLQKSIIDELRIQIENNFNAEISFYYIADEKIKGKVYWYFVKEVYTRYYIYGIVYEFENKKCIYLDYSLIVSVIYETYMIHSILSFLNGCLDYKTIIKSMVLKFYRELGIIRERDFNSSVIILKLSKLRKEIPSVKYLDVTNWMESVDDFVYPDQNVLDVFQCEFKKIIATKNTIRWFMRIGIIRKKASKNKNDVATIYY